MAAASDRSCVVPAQSLVFVALVFLDLLSANCDSNCVKVIATHGKLTIGTGNQDDAVALALDGNVTATAFDVRELTVSRVRSHNT